MTTVPGAMVDGHVIMGGWGDCKVTTVPGAMVDGHVIMGGWGIVK